MSKEQSLIDLINETLESDTVELPVFDDIALRIHREVRENKLDAEGITRMLEDDPVLVSGVLRMANSSFFSGLAEVRSLRDATVRLGLKQVAAIVMSVSQKRMYSASRGPFKARMLELFQHVSAASMAARWIVERAGYRPLADEAFVAGLLHDVGKLSLLRIIEELNQEKSLPLTNMLVETTLDQLYCEHGASLLKRWNLPEAFQVVLRSQADEHPDESNITLMAVRLADKTCAAEGISDRPDPDLSLEDCLESRALGLNEIDIAELRIMLEDATTAVDKAA